MEKYFLSWAELRKQPTRAPPRTTRAGRVRLLCSATSLNTVLLYTVCSCRYTCFLSIDIDTFSIRTFLHSIFWLR